MSEGKTVRSKKVDYAGEGLQLRVRWARSRQQQEIAAV